MSLIYEEYTKLLRRCFFEVQNEVGLGRQEEGYHQACAIWLKENGVPSQSKPPHRLLLNGEVAHTLFPDFVTWDAISTELKAVPRKLGKAEFVQLFDYLKCRNDRLGLLVNLGLDRVHVERVAYQPPQCQLNEDWHHWANHISGRSRDTGTEIRTALCDIYRQHTTGYGDEAVQKLILFALQQRKLNYVATPLSTAIFHNQVVDESRLDCLVIEGCVLLVFTALFDNNQFNISRGLSYMKALNVPWGIAVNFGREIADFTALRSALHLQS